MSISPLSSNLDPLSSSLVNLLNNSPVRAEETEALSEPSMFANLLAESFETAAVTDRGDKTSAVELLLGETDDMSGLLLDAQKAEIALNLALQLRNKVIDAYNEIMRMQV